MRFVIVGAGAIGGTIGALLFERGREVVLVARGAHLDALRARGLLFRTPERTRPLAIPAIGGPSEIAPRGDDVLVLAVKGQDSQAALDAWRGWHAPIVCAQNGVENERRALRCFAEVYGAWLWVPALHLKPGEVASYGAPSPGVIGLGRYPRGLDARAEHLAAELAAAGFVVRTSDDVMRWKWAKLIDNLGNVLDALCVPGPELDDLRTRVVAEGRAVLAAAGVAHASEDETRAARGDHVRVAPIDGAMRPGGSTWQSVARGAGSIEADDLNGEIVLLARLHGVAAPLNEALQELARRAVREHWSPRSVSAANVPQ